MENEFLEQTWVHIPQTPLGSGKHPEKNPFIAMPMPFQPWLIGMVHPISGKGHRHDDKACWTPLTPCHISLLASCPISCPLLSVCISLDFVGWPLSWSGAVVVGYLLSYSDSMSCAIHETSLPLSAAPTSKIILTEPNRALRTQLRRTFQRRAGEFSALARAWVLRVIFFPRPWPI